jgi:hypothetical protein
MRHCLRYGPDGPDGPYVFTVAATLNQQRSCGSNQAVKPDQTSDEVAIQTSAASRDSNQRR